MIKLGQKEAIQRARQLLERQPVFLDTETTGTGLAAEIIEIAIIDYEGKLLLERLVKPKGAIEPSAFQVHGITSEMLHQCPTWKDVWPEVEAVLAGKQVGIYNSDFDVRMMRQSHQKYWMEWRFPEQNFFCIMKLYAQFFGKWDSRRGSYIWQSLDQAGKQCGIPLQNSHRAKDDAHLARALLLQMANSNML
jgi:DNA polymerase-3 subunit epsilon